MLTPMDRFLMLYENMRETELWGLHDVVPSLEENPNLTSEMFELLYSDPVLKPHTDKETLLQNSKLTDEWFFKILKDDLLNSYWLALNPHLTSLQIDTLLNINYQNRNRIVGIRRNSGNTWESELSDEQMVAHVRISLAQYAHLNDAQFKELYDYVEDYGDIMHRSLAQNPNLTAQQIVDLAGVEDKTDVKLAQYSKLTDEVFAWFLRKFPIELSKNEQLTPVQIEAIYSEGEAHSLNNKLRGNLARRSHLTDEMFHKLWEDGWVSSFPINPNLTSSQAEQVIQNDPHQVASIAMNAQLSDDFFLKLFHYYDDNENLTTVRNLAGNRNLYLTKEFQIGIFNWRW